MTRSIVQDMKVKGDIEMKKYGDYEWRNVLQAILSNFYVFGSTTSLPPQAGLDFQQIWLDTFSDPWNL